MVSVWRDRRERTRYVRMAKSSRPLDAVFFLHYYNTQVLSSGMRSGMRPIEACEVLVSFDAEWFEAALGRASRLMESAFDVGAAYFGYQGMPSYAEQEALFRVANLGYSEESYMLAIEAGTRAMR